MPKKSAPNDHSGRRTAQGKIKTALGVDRKLSADARVIVSTQHSLIGSEGK
jgi:hypothetical protein